MRRILCAIGLMLTGCGGGDANRAADSSDLALLIRNPTNDAKQCLHDAEIRRELPAEAPERIDLAHIVVRYAGAKNAGDIERTREEACLRASEVREKLIGGGEWPDVYAKYSDAPKAPRQGELSDVKPDSLEQQFAATAFSLEVDALSYPVETKEGFHIVWRKK